MILPALHSWPGGKRQIMDAFRNDAADQNMTNYVRSKAGPVIIVDKALFASDK